MHLPLRPIFRQSHPNFRGGRNANASEIWAQLTKNLLTKSGTERFRENILMFFCGGHFEGSIFLTFFIIVCHPLHYFMMLHFFTFRCEKLSENACHFPANMRQFIYECYTDYV